MDRGEQHTFSVPLRSVSDDVSVEIAGAKALEVEGDIPIAGRLNGIDDRLSLGDHRRERIDVDFDSCGVVVVANAALPNPEIVKRGLGPLYARQEPD